ncbi:ankyrin repeat protein [Dactylonectria macrodidyma]|uniref:Ankyrin repeat protein n=1 Tax=Dactylonectria macrodidyma TaxID=307937 RepID=A0A9P9FVC9_9HYPO|nr:ankyrin repeat protein [Dactylonectria macrodidyma]
MVGKHWSADCPPEGTSLLHIMSGYGLVQPLSVILQKADQLGTDVDCRDANGRTPLSYAAEKGHEGIVRLLFNTGKVHVDMRDKDGRSPLSWTAEKGHEAVVRLLLDTGKVDIDARDKEYGQTPLSWAAEKGRSCINRSTREHLSVP